MSWWAKPPSAKGSQAGLGTRGHRSEFPGRLTELSARCAKGCAWRRNSSAPWPTSTVGSHARGVCASVATDWPMAWFSWVDLDPLPIAPNIVSIEPKSRRGPLSLGNAGCRLHEKYVVDAAVSTCSRTSGAEQIAGWGPVRTHAADAARALPRPAKPRPLGASLLAAGASPNAGLLGAFASRPPVAESTRAVR